MPNKKSSKEREVVTAVELDELYPQSGEVTSSPQQTNTAPRSLLWIWLSLSVLLILAILVIFQLPTYVATVKQSKKAVAEEATMPLGAPVEELVDPPIELANPVVIPEPAVKEISAEELAAQLQAQSEAEALLVKLVELESTLQKHAVEKWAQEDFAQGSELGRLGDENLRKKNFITAAEKYSLAIATYESLVERIEPTLEQALTSGELALSEGDKPTAITQFELAIAIAPNNERAQNGILRSETIEELFVLLQRGSRLESHNQLQQAKTTYQEAIVLDPLSTEAQSSLARVEAKISNIEYSQLVASAYSSLQNRQYADARAGFIAAGQISPDSKEHKTGLLKVASAERNERIDNLLVEANHFEEGQRWVQAASSYQKILDLNKNHTAAQQGLTAAKAKADLLVGLQTVISAADQLHRNEVLTTADNLLAEVNKQTPVGSIIEQQAEELRALVRKATTPLPVMIESDENTQVTIFKVARLGTFRRREVQLKPGPYTIVGTRAGYQDVRKTFVMTADNPLTTIAIRCEQPI